MGGSRSAPWGGESLILKVQLSNVNVVRLERQIEQFLSVCGKEASQGPFSFS